MKCYKCGFNNSESDMFCSNCGNKLEKDIQVNDGVVVNEVNTVNNDTVSYMNNNVNSNNDTISSTVSTNESLNNKMNHKKKNNKILVMLIVIVLVLIAVFGFLFFGKSKSSSNSIFNNLIKIEKNNLYGYINDEGKVVVEPKYKEASEFKGKYAIVEDEDGLVSLIDTNGKVVMNVNSSYSIKYYEEYDIWVIDDKLYDGSLKQISKEGLTVDYKKNGYLKWKDDRNKKGGIMNSAGKITYTYDFQSDDDYIGIEVSYIEELLKDRYCRVNINNDKYAIVNCNSGKVIYDYTNKLISLKDNNIFGISEKDTYETIAYIYIQDDKILYQTENKKQELDDVNIDKGYIKIEDKDTYKTIGYIDINKGKVVSERPSDDKEENLNLNEWEKMTEITTVKCNSKYSLKKKDKQLLECEWDDFDYFNLNVYKYLQSKGKSYILGKKDGKNYLIDVNSGKIVSEFNSKSVSDSSSSLFINYKDKDTNKRVIYNLETGKSIEIDTTDDYDIYSNYITVEVDNKVNYYNKDLKLIYTSEK